MQSSAHPARYRAASGLFSTFAAVRSAPAASSGAGELLPAGNTPEWQKLYRESIENPTEFWRREANNRLLWDKPFTQVMHHDVSPTGPGLISWFADGRLNAAVNCIDRHIETRGDRIAIIWEKDEANQSETFTYRQLLENVCRVSNVLKRYGVRKGDTVAIYMPMTPHALFVMLACARLGAVHNIVFAGFSADALRDRINDSQARVLITADEGLRGGKHIPLKSIADKALTECLGVKTVLVYERTGNPNIPMIAGRDVSLLSAMKQERPYCPPESMSAEDTLFLLYTSGSTGKPKGLAHSIGGYLVNASLSFEHVFGVNTQPKSPDVFACMADVGWITGHTYICYGPLLNGSTTVVFESLPTYPDASRYWQIVAQHRVTHLYTAPTAIRVLLKAGDKWVEKHDRSSLRVLGTVGEPIGVEAWNWYHRVVGSGKCSVVDTWWQTETGSIAMTPAVGFKPVQAGAATQPFLGVLPAVVDATTGKELTGPNVEGVLVLKHPTPSMARTILNDHTRYFETYWKVYGNQYFTGDGCRRDALGHYWITGRVDDVINVSGHRLGTAEIESAIGTHNGVAESAVVSFPHDVKGEGIFAFVTLKDDVKLTPAAVEQELKATVRARIGGLAIPDVIVIAPLPKTRSGKVMRRILRKIAGWNGSAPIDVKSLGDLSTLADESVVTTIINTRKEMMKRPSK